MFIPGDSCTACYNQTFGKEDTPGYKCVNDLCGKSFTASLVILAQGHSFLHVVVIAIIIKGMSVIIKLQSLFLN